MHLPTEIIGYILQFLTVEEQLKLLDASLQFLYCFGLPKLTEFKILRLSEKNNYVNVLYYILVSKQHLSYDVLCIAARKGHLHLMNTVISLNIFKNGNYNYALGCAAEYGHLSVVERLLQIPGVDATANNNFALRYAARNGHLAVAERLLQIPGVDATASVNYAIKWAAWNGHLTVVKRLLQIPGVDAEQQMIKTLCDGRFAMVI